MECNCFHERIFYYWRHGLYGHVSLLCNEALRVSKNDIFLIIWHSFSLAIIGKLNESLQEMQQIRGRDDLRFLIVLSEFYIRKCVINIKTNSEDNSISNSDMLNQNNLKIAQKNRKRIETLKQRIEDMIQQTNLTSFVAKFSALISIMFSDIKMAERIISVSEESIQILPIKGWTKLLKLEYDSANKIFDEVLNDPIHSFDLMSLYGKAILLSAKELYSESTQVFARILSKYNFPEIFLEKGRVYAFMGRYQLSADVSKETKKKLPTSIEVHIFSVLNSFTKSSNIQNAVKSIGKIVKLCSKYESNNWRFMSKLAHCFGSFSCRNVEINEISMKLAQMAVDAFPENSYCLSVLGYHQMSMDNLIVAQNSLSEALKYDPTNFFAIENLMNLNFFEENNYSNKRKGPKRLKDKRINFLLLKDQLDLYNSISETNLTISMLTAKMNRLENEDNFQMSKSNNQLILVLSEFLSSKILSRNSDYCNNNTYNKEYHTEKENENFSKNTINLPLKSNIFHNNIDNSDPSFSYENEKNLEMELPYERTIDFLIGLNIETIHDSLDEIIFYNNVLKLFCNKKVYDIIRKILNDLHKLLPGHVPLYFFYAYFYYNENRFSESLNMFHSILTSFWPFRIQYCLLMISSIHLNYLDNELALQYLEEALSLDRSLKNTEFFQMLSIKVNRKESKNLKNLEKKNLTQNENGELLKLFALIHKNREHHRSNLMMILKFIDLCIEKNEYPMAILMLRDIAKDAKHSSKTEKGLMVVRQAKINAGRGDFEKSFELLSNLQQHKKFRDIAVSTQAEIYLHIKKDQEKYIHCFINYSKLQPTSHHYEMLADAYSNLKMFDEASNMYIKAISHLSSETSNIDPECIQKCGHSLIAAHRFDDAVSMFIKVVPLLKGQNHTLLYLVEQMIKMKRYKDAKLCINSAVRAFQQSSNSILNAQFLGMKGFVEWKIGEIDESTTSFTKAIQLFEEILGITSNNNSNDNNNTNENNATNNSNNNNINNVSNENHESNINYLNFENFSINDINDSDNNFYNYNDNYFSNNVKSKANNNTSNSIINFNDNVRKNIYIGSLKEKVSQLCFHAGIVYESLQMRDKSLECYTKAFEINQKNTNALIALVSFFKQRMEVQKCTSLCEEYLFHDPFNETVTLLFTSIEQNDFRKSISFLRNLLSAHPHFHRVIIRLIEICARAGHLRIVKHYLGADNEPGMIFARGLYMMYCGFLSSAKNCFEKVENDRKWGTTARRCLFDILVNPDRKFIWSSDATNNLPLSSQDKLQKAEGLLLNFNKYFLINQNIDINDPNNNTNNDPTNHKDNIFSSNYTTTTNYNNNNNINNINNDPNNSLNNKSNNNGKKKNKKTDFLSIMHNNEIEKELLLAEIEKSKNTEKSIESAANRYQKILSTFSITHIPSMVGLASCRARQQRTSEANKLIDRLIHSTKPFHETFSYFEEAYLIKAQLMLNEKSYQAAQRYILLALDLNLSSKKGWSMCAFAHTQNGMHSEAANAYFHCWELSGKMDPEIGYLYSIASIKAKKPEDALQMSRSIMNINPCFKDLREKVIIPSFQMLRP